MTLTIGMSEARDNFSKIAAELNKTGDIVTVFKNNKPYLRLVPVAQKEEVSNAETLAAMKEVEQMAANPNHTPYDDFKDFMTTLKTEATHV